MESLDSPAAADFERPSQARIYDYLLGGSHNFAVDREAARALISMVPDVPLTAHANRAFLRRAVRFLVASGVRQFLDLGSGVPTAGNVHEVARQLAPDARVVYVDIDPVAVAEGRQILAGDEQTLVLREDARRPERIVGHPAVRGLLDFDRPVGLVVASLLHFIPDADDPQAVLAVLRDALAPGSYLVLSHITAAGQPQVAAQFAASEQAAIFAMPREPGAVHGFFAGFDLVPPGLVPVERWRPDPTTDPVAGVTPGELSCLYAGVGRRN
ncbi:MAG TPA: SAM-dependent methyltransferase [Mycobacteriales bacterium]|nr:SAM-dependent methyltransferase [Mycobacteriales bacterium]